MENGMISFRGATGRSENDERCTGIEREVVRFKPFHSFWKCRAFLLKLTSEAWSGNTLRVDTLDRLIGQTGHP